MRLEEGFIICDSKKKEAIIRNDKDFSNYIFLSYSELKNKLLGSFSDYSVIALHDKFNLSYDLVREHLKYIQYVENKEYQSSKINQIVKEKNYLIENNLFKIDEFFYYRLSQFPLTFINPKKDKEFELIKGIVEKKTRVNIVEEDKLNNLTTVYRYENHYDELVSTFNIIKSFIESGIPYNKIYLANVPSSYNYLLKRLAISYNIPLNMTDSRNVLRMDISRKFIELSTNDLAYDEIFKSLNNNDPYFLPILNIINKYQLGDKSSKKYLDFVIAEMKKIPYETKKYYDMVNVCDLDGYLDDDYVFYLNFTLGSAPVIALDEAYLTDKELQELGLNTSTELNIINKDRLINKLNSMSHLHVSMPKEINGKEISPSLLINELKLEVIDSGTDYGFSYVEDTIRLSTEYNKYTKFNSISSDLEVYNTDYLKYGSYNNKFKGIDKKLLDDFYSEKRLDLSYSTMKKYYACPFSYFASRVLGLDEFEKTLATSVGTYGHAILEDSYKPGFDFEASKEEHKKEAQNGMERFYYDKMDDILESLLEFNKNHDELSTLNEVRCEELVEFEKDEYHFVGYIDKLYYHIEGDDAYAVIVDYKTGSDEMSLDNFEDGFNMQLPVYMLMLNKYEPFKGKSIHIVGVYLQKVNIIKLDMNEDINKQLFENFKLKGYSINNKGYIALFDPSYFNSDYIKSMRVKNDGEFYGYTKVFSERDQDYIITKIASLIDNCAHSIRNGEFSISPKRIDGKNQSCAFCKYKDLCSCTFDDFIDVEKKKFKGCDDDGMDS